LLKNDNAQQFHINSAQLSRLTGTTQETVRSDLMLIGQSVKHQKRLPGAGHDRLYQ
jgi:DeoR/GlpR family transcriptional regulator of sugar metabolism